MIRFWKTRACVSCACSDSFKDRMGTVLEAGQAMMHAIRWWYGKDQDSEMQDPKTKAPVLQTSTSQTNLALQ